nr:unnamed protein product [Spirometra erinaceieuropaei]
MVAVEVQYLCRICRLPEHYGFQATTIFAAEEDIQEGRLAVFFLLHCKLNVREDGVEMFFECRHLIQFDDDEGVTHIPSPEFRSVVSENQRLQPLKDRLGYESQNRRTHWRHLHLLVDCSVERKGLTEHAREQRVIRDAALENKFRKLSNPTSPRNDKLEHNMSKQLTKDQMQVLRHEAAFNTADAKPVNTIAAVNSVLIQTEATEKTKSLIRPQNFVLPNGPQTAGSAFQGRT